MRFPIKLRDARTALANRRTMRVAHRRLTGELASFRTTAERAELDEILGRHSVEEAEEIRTILYGLDLQRTQSAVRPTSGLGGYHG